MALSEQADIPWSDKIYSPKEAAKKLGTPCMVQVVLGCEDEEFSPGFFLKLDFGIAIRKVGAHFVPAKPGSASKHNDENEILIPLGYSGKVKVVVKDAGNKVFTSVTELIKEFPRFVEAENSFSAFEESSNKDISVVKGSRLELKEAVGSQKLYCNFENKTITLTNKNLIKVRLLADDTIYTLQEVVDRLHLPQTVKFQDAEFQKVAESDLSADLPKQSISDTLILNRITNHEVVVGILKSPSSTQGGIKKKVKQTLCLFPVVSASVGKVEVKIPSQKTDKNYTTTMRKLFPQEVDRNLINKSLYLDLAKDTNIYVLKDKGWVKVKPSAKPATPTSEDVPPPLPPSRDQKKLSLPNSDGKTGRRSPSPRPDKSKPESPRTESPKTPTPPALKPREPAEINKKRNESPITVCIFNDGPWSPSLRNTQENWPSLTLTPTKKTPAKDKTPPTPKEAYIPEYYEEPVSSTTPGLYETAPQSQSQGGAYEPLKVETDQSFYEDAYIYDDLTLPEDIKDKKTDKKNGRISWNPFKKKKDSKDLVLPDSDTSKGLPAGGSCEQKDKDEIRLLKAESKKDDKKNKKDKDKSDSKKEDNKKDKDKKSLFGTLTRNQKLEKPVGKVTPNARGSAVVNETFQFSELTVGQLTDRLRLCELNDLANICEKETLDGSFLTKCTDDSLAKEPFNMSAIQIMKLSRIKDGWTPKH